jgi:hypothetical protein
MSIARRNAGELATGRVNGCVAPAVNWFTVSHPKSVNTLIVVKGTPDMLLILPPLTTLNDYINSERRNRFIGAKVKRMDTETVAWIAKSTLKPINQITSIDFTFRVKDKRTDKDNLIFCTKFILDGLVLAGIIKGDGWKYTPADWTYHFEVSPRHEIEVRINENQRSGQV